MDEAQRTSTKLAVSAGEWAATIFSSLFPIIATDAIDESQSEFACAQPVVLHSLAVVIIRVATLP